MANPGLTAAQIAEMRAAMTKHARAEGGFNVSAIARDLGLPRGTAQTRIVTILNTAGREPAQAKPTPAGAGYSADALDHATAIVKSTLLKGAKTWGELLEKTNLDTIALARVLERVKEQGVHLQRFGDRYEISAPSLPSYVEGAQLELVSRPDNTFLFGAAGDLHAGSKYCRWDVREDLYRRFEAAGAQASFDTGNWIDGEKSFNKHDLVAHGLDEQVRVLAEKHPRSSVPTYAVAGDDHEGWFAQSEGIDVGRYCENAMRAAGHLWTDLGYMEAHVKLTNYNTGKSAILAVTHPGGGSAYALSYSVQKIVESFEGGEKPAVLLAGHFHKLWAGLIRNVWCVQTGTQQDQTPFMRKKRLESHVGGTLVELEQDPETGAILSMKPQIIRYFNTGYYEKRWSHSGPINLPKRAVGAGR